MRRREASTNVVFGPAFSNCRHSRRGLKGPVIERDSRVGEMFGSMSWIPE